jgi:hypothetical protein
MSESYIFMRSLLFICLYLCASAAYADDNFLIPEGYVLQRLEPTDGKIARPKDWFYANSATSSGWVWTLSAEDPEKGGYETGLRIQLLTGVEKGTKSTRDVFVQNFLQQKRSLTKVVRECPAIEQGEFKRQCLEVTETIQRPKGPVIYRVLYSMFWGKALDMVILNTFGAPEEKWESVVDISKVTSNVEVIGPNFGK